MCRKTLSSNYKNITKRKGDFRNYEKRSYLFSKQKCDFS